MAASAPNTAITLDKFIWSEWSQWANGRCLSAACRMLTPALCTGAAHKVLELQTNHRQQSVFTITEKAPTRLHLIRHYAKQALTHGK